MFPVKVAYDCHVFTWLRYGGVARYFVELAKHVAQAQAFSVEVVAPLHVSPYLRDSGLRVRGFYAPAVPRLSGRIFRGINRLVSVPYLWGYPPHVLHETYYDNWSYRPPRASVVVTVHDMTHYRYAHLYGTDRFTVRKKMSVERADGIICVSEYTRQDLVEFLRVPAERIRVIHLGAGLPDQSKRPPSPTHLPGPYLLYVGDRGFQKNFSCLLKAFASSPRLRGELTLVAFGRQPFQPHETELMNQLGLREGAVVYRAGDDDILASYYSHAAALVFPSLNEGFGLPTLEAMSFGCPVICSNSSVFPEVVGDSAVLFDPDDVESVRAAIERVVFSDEIRATLIARGRERIKQFSWERCAAQTTQFYREVCGR